MHISIVALSSIVAASSVLGAPAPDLESRGVDVGIIVWVDSGYNGATAKLVVADGQCCELLPYD